MKHLIYYKIADIVICVSFDFIYKAENGYMNQFVLEEPETPDYYFEFKAIQNIQPFLKKAPYFKGAMHLFHYYQDEAEQEYCFHVKNTYYHAVTVLEEKRGHCFYISQEWLREQVEGGYYLENFFCLEKILMKFQCMTLHSCHIQKDGQAILFSAPSGTGKSTQGDLWQQHAGAEVINGDRTAIRKADGHWMAYGLPFCGTSGIHKNKQAPIRAVIILRQYSENQVSMLQGKKAFSAIYSELTVNAWNREFVEEAIQWTLNLAEEIPIYQFLCTKDSDAVFVLQDYMERKERNQEE